MSNLIAAVNRFDEWAAAELPERRCGEWECDYPDWRSLYQAVFSFLAQRSLPEWSADDLKAILFVIARDNENQQIARELRTRHPETLIGLALFAATQGEPDARWQLADQLGRTTSASPTVDSILLAFAQDEHEYVRRRALQSLARRRSPAVEELARLEWTLPAEEQEYSRMAALWSLHRINSPILGGLLDEAERDNRQYLAAFAQKVRRGEVDP